MCGSCRAQPPEPGFAEAVEGGEPDAKNLETVRCDLVWLATVFGGQRFDPACFHEAADGAVECSRAEAGSGETGYVVDHGVPMLGAVREAGEHEQWRIRIAGAGRDRCCYV